MLRATMLCSALCAVTVSGCVIDATSCEDGDVQCVDDATSDDNADSPAPPNQDGAADTFTGENADDDTGDDDTEATPLTPECRFDTDCDVGDVCDSETDACITVVPESSDDACTGEVCLDGLDNNCDGVVDDGCPSVGDDDDTDDLAGDDDTDDGDFHAAHADDECVGEICLDGLDNDCDDIVDEGCPIVGDDDDTDAASDDDTGDDDTDPASDDDTGDDDTDDTGDDDTDAASDDDTGDDDTDPVPETEVCDGADNDLDGTTDEGDPCNWATTTQACFAGVCLRDADRDGVQDTDDNCPAAANVNQQDGDSDGVGNVCDNCPAAANEAQSDADDDGTGDTCDSPPDGPPADEPAGDDDDTSDDEPVAHGELVCTLSVPVTDPFTGTTTPLGDEPLFCSSFVRPSRSWHCRIEELGGSDHRMFRITSTTYTAERHRMNFCTNECADGDAGHWMFGLTPTGATFERATLACSVGTTPIAHTVEENPQHNGADAWIDLRDR